MKVSEPLIAYGLLPQSLESEMGIVRYARHGVRTRMLWDFLKSIKSSKADFEAFLPYSLKTFSRKEVLDEEMGERVLNIIRVFKRGEELFGDIERFKSWLNKYHPILKDEPKNFLKTSTGCNILIDEIGRIEHGILA